jgi:hypothetical protein
VAALLSLAGLALPSCMAAAELDLRLVTDRLERPVDLVGVPGSDRIYVVEQVGRVRLIEGGRLLHQPVLDIRRLVSRGNEQGLLGIALHPRFEDNGLLFVNYTDREHATHVVRYRIAAGGRAIDPGSRLEVLYVPQPYSNHNGGQVLFGPDGMLYVPLGDGGAGGDPHGNGQNLGTLLGKLLRIDVDRGSPYAVPSDNPFVGRRGARPEIWAYGLRNPWRIAFDRGLLYIGDVGQNRWEEVDVVSARQAGINYGWNHFEGSHAYRGRPDAAGMQMPVLEYGRGDGCTVIGGLVYRGPVARLRGLYFYADHCQGWIESLRFRGGRVTERTRWRVPRGLEPTAFGEDAAHHLYVLDLGGAVYRVAGAR